VSDGNKFESYCLTPEEGLSEYLKNKRDQEKYERIGPWSDYITPHGTFFRMANHWVNFGMLSPQFRYKHRQTGKEYPSHAKTVQEFYQEWLGTPDIEKW
jgi:hypothetical protein